MAENTQENVQKSKDTPNPKRSLSTYFSIFFSAVLIVVLVATYTQGQQLENTKNDLQTNSSALDELQDKYSKDMQEATNKIEGLTKYKQSMQALARAQNSFNAGDLAGAKTYLGQVDAAVISEADEKAQYAFLEEKIKDSEKNA